MGISQLKKLTNPSSGAGDLVYGTDWNQLVDTLDGALGRRISKDAIESGLFLISDVTLTQDVGGLTFANIPQDGRHLLLIARGKATLDTRLHMAFNAVYADYYSRLMYSYDGTVTTYYITAFTAARIADMAWGPSGEGSYEVWIYDYTDTSHNKSWFSLWRGPLSNYMMGVAAGIWDRATPAAITSIRLWGAGAANLAAGSRFTLYKVV